MRGRDEYAIYSYRPSVQCGPARIRKPGGPGAGPGRPCRTRRPLHPHRLGRDPGRLRPDSGNQANQEGALQLLARQPYGLVSLWLLGIGFAGYALWRLSEAAFGVTGEGNGAGPRLKSLVRGVVYAFFAYLTFQIIAGTGRATSPRSSRT